MTWSFAYSHFSPDNRRTMLRSIAHKPPTSSHTGRNVWEHVIWLLEDDIIVSNAHDAGEGGRQCFTLACFFLIDRAWMKIKVGGRSRVRWLWFLSAEEAPTRSPNPVQCMTMARLMKIWLYIIKTAPISSTLMLTNEYFINYYNDNNGMLQFLMN